MARYVVARADALAEGEHIVVEARGLSIGVFLLDGGYYGLLNRCPHRGGPMCRGAIVGALDSDGPGDYRVDMSRPMLECPWHGWEFDIKTGRSYFDPRRTRIRSFPVAREHGAELLAERATADGELVPGPYTAETVAVTVEDDYIVVELP